MCQGGSLNEATYEKYTPESLKQGGCGFCDPTSAGRAFSELSDFLNAQFYTMLNV